MTTDNVIRSLWKRIEARDWAGLSDLLHPQVVLEWPASGERFVGVDAVVGLNAEYPQGWSVEVCQVVADGPRVVSEVRVPVEGTGDFVAASFWTVRDGRVVHGREYWTTCVA